MVSQVSKQAHLAMSIMYSDLVMLSKAPACQCFQAVICRSEVSVAVPEIDRLAGAEEGWRGVDRRHAENDKR